MLFSRSTLLSLLLAVSSISAIVIKRDDNIDATISLNPPINTRLVPDIDTKQTVGYGTELQVFWANETLSNMPNNNHAEQVVWWDWFEDNGATTKWHLKCKARINTNFRGVYHFDLLKDKPWRDAKGDVVSSAAGFACFKEGSSCVTDKDCDKMPVFGYDYVAPV
ncbi:uncharacterized protein I206_102934 [Kwoniella pini CBS 10737]|uniref:Uncharacterized protein n=1 Tax=Kwoniella pini CBS 10737 TaxID=1296096 RepID=A0A1B9I6V0_9TREE|nr:uncharacterized protein I206_03285 [Kwoniella pini CBS 10737]OCF51219.1 hypothetical protein I206_03285 [Kwoniella pini CBS 10737]